MCGSSIHQKLHYRCIKVKFLNSYMFLFIRMSSWCLDVLSLGCVVFQIIGTLLQLIALYEGVSTSCWTGYLE